MDHTDANPPTRVCPGLSTLKVFGLVSSRRPMGVKGKAGGHASSRDACVSQNDFKGLT